MSVEPDNKLKYVKLLKNTIIASVLITLALSLLEIPKSYFGTPVGIAVKEQVILHLKNRGQRLSK